MKYLVKKAQKKDDQAFVELMERCKSGMYKVARSYLKDDADIADAIQHYTRVFFHYPVVL